MYLLTKHNWLLILILLSISVSAENLLTRRGTYKTALIKNEKYEDKIDVPPKNEFALVQFPTRIGKMAAYVSRHQNVVNLKRPAIVWLTGGFPESSPGSFIWEKAEYENEQGAQVYRKNGIVMMFPMLRGRVKGNPGLVENFYGEVEDVISAGKFLKNLPFVDPNRVYLGGHSTGGTLALLVAESTDIFAGVICLGPVENNYGEENSNYKWNRQEVYYRAPINFLQYIKSPTYIVEGKEQESNMYALVQLAKRLEKVKNPNVNIMYVEGANHFTAIHPVNRIFTHAILNSRDGKLNIIMGKHIKYALKIFNNIKKSGTTHPMQVK